MSDTDAIVLGAGPAGLAAAACLGRRGLRALVLEAQGAVGASWRGHYERLHLHTARDHSALPHLPFPAGYPTYPSRQQVVDYLDAYTRHFAIHPRLGEEVRRAAPVDGGWEVQSAGGIYRAPNLVVATGYNRVPERPRWPGEEGFGGRVLHAREYRSGAPFAGQRVLVVGLGNTGGEIAIDLHEHGARPSLSVRGPVRVMPREILGQPAQVASIQTRHLPLGVRDLIARLTSRLVFGDLTPYGLAPPDVGPVVQVEREEKIPLIDVGTVALVKRGEITVYPAIERFVADGVCFVDGRRAEVDAVVLATGYRPGLEGFLEGAEALVDARGYPRVRGGRPARPGLYFLGFSNPITGFLRQIALDAEACAASIAAEVGVR